MAPAKYCPTCKLNNKRNKLILNQINFRIAVYLCQDKNCTYPEGYNSVEIKHRTLNELLYEKKQLTDEVDLDSWLKEFFQEDEKKSVQGHENDSIHTEDLSKIIDEINNVHNENDLDLEYDSDMLSWIDEALQDNGSNEIASYTESMNISEPNDIIILDKDSEGSVDSVIPINQLNKTVTSIICNDEQISDIDSGQNKIASNNEIINIDKPSDNINQVCQLSKTAITSIICNDTYRLEDSCRKNLLVHIDTGRISNNLLKSRPGNEENVHNKQTPVRYRILNFEQTFIPVENKSEMRNYKNRIPSKPHLIQKLSITPSQSKKACISKKAILPSHCLNKPTTLYHKPNKHKDIQSVTVIIKPTSM